MGKRKLAGVLLLLCLFIFSVNAGAEEKDCQIEQVSIRMPKVTVYYRADTPEEHYEAYLGGKNLSNQNTLPFLKTGEGVDYYLLLDISASIPEKTFDNIKAGINKFIASLNENDRCILLSFGNEVNVVLNGTVSPGDAAPVVNGLQNKDMETVLFKAIVQMSEMIEKEDLQNDKRRVAIAVTDGEDYVTGQETAQEALKTLNSKSIPLYAMAVDVGKNEYINSFGEFARNTGGTLSIYKEGDSFATLSGIKNTVEGAFKVIFQGENNIVSNTREDLTIKFLDHKVTKNIEVLPARWVEDSENPLVDGIEKVDNNHLKITFSEPVEGAENTSGYRIMKDKKAVVPTEVTYVGGEKPTAELTFADPLITGTYEFSFINMTDVSMEKNALDGTQTKEITGVKEENQYIRMLKDWWWILLIVVFAIVLGVILILYRKVKRNKGVIYVEGKAAFASSVDVKQHVSSADIPTKKVFFRVRDRKNGNCSLDVAISGSTIVGRSDMCDVYFDDPKMSRQHFVLETDGTDIHITDLDTRNGTSVNGILIKAKRKLAVNDEITAGDVSIRIEW